MCGAGSRLSGWCKGLVRVESVDAPFEAQAEASYRLYSSPDDLTNQNPSPNAATAAANASRKLRQRAVAIL